MPYTLQGISTTWAKKQKAVRNICHFSIGNIILPFCYRRGGGRFLILHISINWVIIIFSPNPGIKIIPILFIEQYPSITGLKYYFVISLNFIHWLMCVCQQNTNTALVSVALQFILLYPAKYLTIMSYFSLVKQDMSMHFRWLLHLKGKPGVYLPKYVQMFSMSVKVFSSLWFILIILKHSN